jgi:hypothetical protein
LHVSGLVAGLWFFGAWPIRAADELKLGMILSKSNKNFAKNNEIQ